MDKPPATRKAGRPELFTPELGGEVCQRMALGKTLTEVCRADDMPSRATVTAWLLGQDEAHKQFQAQYTRARELLADTLFDQSLDIADDGSADYKLKGRNGDQVVIDTEAVQRSKLRVETRLKMAARLRPNLYGDKGAPDSEDAGLKITVIGGLPSG